jgi:Domain of unknown function (DUF222)
MCTATGPAAPADTGHALAMVRAGLGYLAACDAASLGTAAQAAALTGLEAAEAQHTAARAKILAAFTAQHGYEADGQYGAAAWLRATTRITRHAAGTATGWARRLGAHPVIGAALAAGQLPASLARLICDATDQLPDEYRADADGILLAAVLGGADQHGLARLAREMLERARTGPGTGEDGFEERAVWLGTTFGGAGRLQADLTPACAAALTVVLDALGQKTGPEDTRTAAQRRHDAIEEACRRLISGQMIPGRDGQPAHLIVHVDLNDLRGGSVAERCWTPAMAAAGPGTVHLTGPAAQAAACDAILTPMVTGHIDWAVLDQLTAVWLTTRGHAHTGGPHKDHPGGPQESQAGGPEEDHADGLPEGPADGPPESQPEDHPGGPHKDHSGGPRDGQADSRPHSHDANQPAARPGDIPCPGAGAVPFPGTGRPPGPAGTPAAADSHDCAISGCLEATRQRLHATILRWSLDLLSGPGGLAGHLRGTLLGAPFNTPASPLTWAAPPAPSPRTCAPPSSSGTSIASFPAAPSHRPYARCTI